MTLVEKIKDQSFGFTELQTKNICFIAIAIQRVLTGEVNSCGSGGNHFHIFLQMKDKRWLLFHSATGDINVSNDPYETGEQIYEAFMNDDGGDCENGKQYEYVTTALYVQTTEDEEFQAPLRIAKRILNKEFKNAFA